MLIEVFFYFRMVKKVEGPCPPVWKVEGPLAPCSPRFCRLWHKHDKRNQIHWNCTTQNFPASEGHRGGARGDWGFKKRKNRKCGYNHAATSWSKLLELALLHAIFIEEIRALEGLPCITIIFRGLRLLTHQGVLPRLLDSDVGAAAPGPLRLLRPSTDLPWRCLWTGTPPSDTPCSHKDVVLYYSERERPLN